MFIIVILLVQSLNTNHCCSERNSFLKIKNGFSFNQNGDFHHTISTKTVQNQLGCALQCINSLECDAAVICNATSEYYHCFLVLGNVFSLNASSYELNNCEAISMDNCLNGGTYFGKMCHCKSGFTGHNCEIATPGYCHQNTWKKQLSKTADGVVTDGNPLYVHNSVKNGEVLKVLLKTTHDVIYSISLSGVSSTTDAWAFTTEHLSLKHNNRSSTNIFRIIRELQTPSNISTWSYGFDTNSDTVTPEFVAMDWYSRSYINAIPCLVTNNNIPSSGSTGGCRQKLMNGSALQTDFGKLVTVTTNQTSLSGDFPAMIAHGKSGNRYFIKQPSYHVIYTDNSDTSDTTFRWYILTHSYRSGSNPPISETWYVDECWHEIYSHSASGNIILGSKTYLKNNVLNGKSVRVISNGRSSSVRDVRIKDGEIIGVMHDSFNAADKSQNIGQRIRTQVSTSGSINICTFLWESDLNRSWSSATGGTRWFVESRFWTKILSFNSAKHVVLGSVLKLYNVVYAGNNIRITVHHLDGSIQALTINHVHIYNTTFMVLDTATLEKVVQNGNNYDCENWSGFMGTDGIYETVKWTTGSSLIEGRTNHNYKSIDVFYQE